jgi:mRNA-degrading endonuclease toxin of MazEF toxin-antitoxin module
VKRGEIWSVSGGPEYAGKPRPVAILQDHRFEGLQSIGTVRSSEGHSGHSHGRLREGTP